MHTLRTHISSLFRSAKLLIVLLACTLYLATATSPALAFGGGSSKPSEGVPHLSEIQQKSVEAANPDADVKSMKEVQRTAEKGINEVQGRADYDKMKTPSNSEGNTVIDDIKAAAESLTDS